MNHIGKITQNTIGLFFIAMLVGCTQEKKDVTRDDHKVPEQEAGRYTTDAGAASNPTGNATASPGMETNDAFNFSSDSSYQRGEDPVRRTGKNETSSETTANRIDEGARSLSGGSTNPDNASASANTQNTTRTAQGSEVIENIQKEIRSDINFSPSAHNIKITSQNGQIYLRGVVENPSEKTRLEQVAKRIAGNNLVINELDVKNR